MKKYAGYRVQVSILVPGKRAAESVAQDIRGQYGGRITIHPQALDSCPDGYDHAHMRYDGNTLCHGCGGELGEPKHNPYPVPHYW